MDDRPTIAAPDDDPHLWLEEVDGEKALAWVARQNRMTVVPEVRHRAARSEMVLAAVPAGSLTASAATLCSAGARFGISARICAIRISGVCADVFCGGRRRAGCGMPSLYGSSARMPGCLGLPGVVGQRCGDRRVDLLAQACDRVLRAAAEVHRVGQQHRP